MLRAVEHVRGMRGGAQSHLIRADDGNLYVVKVINNPQHPRILANEWMAAGIGRSLSLSIPPFAAIELTQDFIATNGVNLRLNGSIVPVASGPAFGSRVPASRTDAPIYDYLPEPGLLLVKNLYEFAGILAFDKWLGNCDGRQAIFCRPSEGSGLHAYFIDHGFVFNAGDWDFRDSPLRGVYSRNCVYRGVMGMQSFEPWLSRIERFRPRQLHAIARSMPEAWRPDTEALDALLIRLLERRRLVRGLIEAVRASSRAPFENWGRQAPVPLINPQPVKEGAYV